MMSEWVSLLPHLHAGFNLAATLALLVGWLAIRRGEVEMHRRFMLMAFCCSVLFLTSYLVYHAKVGSVRFSGEGNIRLLYFALLSSHSLLAALVPFLAIVTLWRGLRGRYGQHRRIARWTLPIWLYVSITGVAVYWMLYHYNPY
jgi:uncharacterized membrane protein YozB (DUF420 family)